MRKKSIGSNFWEGQGVHKSDVVYHGALVTATFSAVLDELINPGKTRIAGLVCGQG